MVVLLSGLFLSDSGEYLEITDGKAFFFIVVVVVGVDGLLPDASLLDFKSLEEDDGEILLPNSIFLADVIGEVNPFNP